MSEYDGILDLDYATSQRDFWLAQRKRDDIFLVLWLLGLLATASFFVFCAVTNKESSIRSAIDPSAYQGSFGNKWLPFSFILLVFVAIGAFLWVLDWRRTVEAAKKAEEDYQKSLDKEMRLKKARLARKQKKPKGGQD